MKKTIFFLLNFLVFNLAIAQDYCTEADSNLIYAYSNVKDSYESNNIDHLKYYADRSLKSFIKAQENLKNCGCESAYNLAIDAADLLAKVETQETFEDGRFFVKRAKEIAQNSITALNQFTANNYVEQTTSVANTSDATNAIDDLQAEQARLEQQQLALKQKEAEIAKQLAAQKAKAVTLEKEALINKYNKALILNIETYNNLLKAFGSGASLSFDTVNNTNLLQKNTEDIKAYFIENTKKVTQNYLAELDGI